MSEDSAPNPSEALLAAFGSCLCILIRANAIARSIPVRHLEVELTGELNIGALWGTSTPPDRTPGFAAIDVSVSIDAEAPREVLKKLVDQAAIWSPVANTLHNPVHLAIRLA